MSIDTLYRNYDSGSSDPYSSYGQPQSGQTGDSGYYQAYEQQLLSYIQSLKAQMGTLQQGTASYQQAQDYLNTAMGYLGQIDPQMANDPSLGGGSWNPLSGGYGSGMPGSSDPTNPLNPTDPNSVAGVAGSTTQPVNSFPISYQDTTHIVTDEGDTTSITLSESDPETRNIDVYQKGNTLIVPSNSANVNVQAQADDAVAGATMFVVTYTVNGKTRTVKYHNVDREDFKLDVQTPDKTQVTMDASLTSSQFASKVTNNQASDIANMQGTPPDDTTSDTRTWNKNDAVDYYATEGTETDEIYADTVNITLPDRSDTAKVTKTDDHEYTVEIYDSSNKLLRTIHVHQVTGDGCINFNHLAQENLQYKDATPGSTGGFKHWDDPTCKKDSFITVNGQAGGALAGPLDPNHADDTVPDSISKDGTTATYNNVDNQGVSVHTYPDDDVTKHDISTNGTVDIYPNTVSDTAFVDYFTDSDGTGKIRIMIQTKDANGKAALEYFIIDASMANKVNIHLDASKITYDTENNVIPSDIATKIKDADGKAASDAIAKDALTSNASIQALMDTYNCTADEISAAMAKEHLTADDFTPPLSTSSDVMGKMIQFLRDLDPALDKELKNTDLLKSDDPTNADSIATATNDVMKALKGLGYDNLHTWKQGDFPAQIFYTYAQTAGLMSIDGHIFNLFDSSGDANLSKWTCVDITQPHLALDPTTGAPMVPPEGGSTAWILWSAQYGAWIGNGSQEVAQQYADGNFDNFNSFWGDDGLTLNSDCNANYLTGNDWATSDQSTW